jgi:hypothetical protein
MKSTDPSLHYRHPPSKAFQLNKLLYRVRMDAAVRTRFIEDPDGVIGEYQLSAEEIAAVKALDVSRLSALGAHRLLGFMARFNVEHDRRAAGSPSG